MAFNVLRQVDQGAWCLESHFVTWGCKGSLRMTVIETARGLILYSPVALSDEHVDQIKAMGTVVAIVAPNLFHHFHLRACMASFPQAQVFVPKGLPAKIGAIPGATEIMSEGDLPDFDEVASCLFSGHALQETVLLHRPTGTLITADLLYNFQAEHFAAEKAFFGLIGCYGRPGVAFYHGLALKDKGLMRRSVATVADWPVRRIIMSHGRIIEDEAAAAIFAMAWQGLLAG